MAWIGITDHLGALFDARGLGPDGARPDSHTVPVPDDLVVPTGSIMIETGLSAQMQPQPLLTFAQNLGEPFQINLQGIPGGGLVLVIANGDDLQHCTISHAETGRTDVLRIIYSWDTPSRSSLVTVERSDSIAVNLFPLGAPKPVLMRDLRALCLGQGHQVLSDDVAYFAVATHIERAGPSPTLGPGTPIATPKGYRAVETLRRGDTVLTANGGTVPVLCRIDREVPARGMFRPIVLRMPYFGLKQDIVVAPDQRLVLQGSEVEYLFGHEAVLVPVRHLVGAAAEYLPHQTGTLRYSQLLLPGHEVLDAAGTAAESLFIGRIRRKKQILAASLLSDLERNFLPDHGASVHPILRAYDAQVLADYRAA